ncbi:MAG: queuosine precursor transporter [Chlamydiales bacterium]
METRAEYVYLSLATLFSVIVIISNVITVKLISLPFFDDFAIPCGLITYPITFLIGDLITEIFGEKKAKRVVYMGFSMSLVAYTIIKIAMLVPAHPQWAFIENHYGYETSEQYQNAFASVFEINGIALVSSLLAYAASQLMDIRLFSFLGELTRRKHLWFRNSGSTLASQIIDTLIVNVLLLYCGLKLELDLVIKISLLCYLYKAFFTILNIPIFYASVYLVKKILNTETTQTPQIAQQSYA